MTLSTSLKKHFMTSQKIDV